MKKDAAIRILLAKVGIDAHDIGIRFVARSLRDQGMEVIYLGLYQMPGSVLHGAIEEDADIIGFSFLGGDHLLYINELVTLMKQENCNIPIVVGGVIPQQDFAALREMGVREIFEPGSSTIDITNTVKGMAREPKRKVAQSKTK